MSLTEAPSGPLREILAASKIAYDETTLSLLWLGDNSPAELTSPGGSVHGARIISGLCALKRQFWLMRAGKMRRSRDKLADECRRILEAAAVAADIIDMDLGESCELEVLLNSFGVDTVKTTEVLHCLRDAAEQAFALLRTDEYIKSLFPDAAIEVRPIPQRPRIENDETWLFVELYHLYCAISRKTGVGNDQGGPLYRFVKGCAALIDNEIQVSEPRAFRACLRAALRRRKGGKTGPD